MNLREDHVRLPGGSELEEYHVIEYPDWVCIVCRTDDDQLVLVEQYRYGIDAVTFELPGGAIDPGEDAAVAAIRELKEETGFAAREWVFIGKCAPDPTRHTNWAWCYFASGGFQAGEQELEATEDMHVRILSVSEVLEAADEGRFVHGVHLAALFLAARRGFLEIPSD